ncbi:hypothetical protein C8Q77DRAFT_1053331 [Trametes polyzona]|nr:hypothetical protein C8Q77DRAFT_1053331 [Trametes polyzona]
MPPARRQRTAASPSSALHQLTALVSSSFFSATRQVQNPNAPLDPEVIAKRTKRHLDELERSNYSEPAGTSVLGGKPEEDDGTTISDKRQWDRADGKKPKKSTMNVRTAVLYKKSLAVLIDESGIEHLPPSVPTYLRAVTPPPREPPRMLCSVCSFWGKYKCKRCAMPYCDLNCEAVHNETRCERRVM